MEGDSEDQKSEFSMVVKEIMSLQRERRELLASFTPEVSAWRLCRGIGEERPLVRFAGKDYSAAAPVQIQDEMETESASASTTGGEQLGRYFDSILQDMEDLGHRMLSMAYVVVKPDGAAISSYMADELVNSTSKLMDACKELYKYTEDADNEQAEELQKNFFLEFYRAFLKKPWNYENRLALVVTKEEEEGYEKEMEKKIKMEEEVTKERMEKWKRWKEKQKEMEKYDKEKKKKGKGKVKEFEFQVKRKEKEEERIDPDPATMEYLKKGMEVTEQFFADDRDGWYTTWGSKSIKCGDFRDKTALSPMHFTHYTPDTIPSSCGVTGSTLQIYSIKICELKMGLKWPLKLYGVVAARDTVDRNRNIVFSRSSLNCQELGENGSLCLTGPSRAIVALDSVDFEVELEIKEGEESQGKQLITLSKRYDGTCSSLIFENSLCKVVLNLEQLSRAVQATIVGVSVVEGKWPFRYGCRVACSLAAIAEEVVLLDCRGGGKDKQVRVGSNGYLHLSRNVISVPSQERLKVAIGSYSESGSVDYGDVHFTAQKCQTSEGECLIGTSKVKVVVAWSLLFKEKRDFSVNCPAVEP